ncbi:MAG TPA: YqgE/AlgH family protein [Burkholderiales bacterium]|nr:YqgE/AlgH family protein [Burkholderiales bacterium]
MKRHLLAAALLIAAAAAQAQAPSRSIFLIARPGLPDPNFRESVVLVLSSDRGDATGVIINRPTNRSLAEILPGDRFAAFTDPISFGGPVAPQGLFALFQSAAYSGPALPMLPGVWLAVLPDSVDALLDKPPARIRFFAGYSGWGPGQLQEELDRGDWLIVDADAKTVFQRDTSRLWQDMVRRARAVHASAAAFLTSSIR